jgi:hypothetical protein
MLVFLASQEFGVSNVRNFLYEATGVSNSYLSKLIFAKDIQTLFIKTGAAPGNKKDCRHDGYIV